MTLSKAFDELAHGVGLLPHDAAIDTAGLHTILKTAKSAYEAGDVVNGAHLLQDFEDQRTARCVERLEDCLQRRNLLPRKLLQGRAQVRSLQPENDRESTRREFLTTG